MTSTGNQYFRNPDTGKITMQRTILGSHGGNATELSRFHQGKEESGKKYFKVKTKCWGRIFWSNSSAIFLKTHPQS